MKEPLSENMTVGEEILGNLGFWPIILAMIALAASFLFKAQSFWLLPAVFGLLALTKIADAARYFIYVKDTQKAIRSLSMCILFTGLAVCSPKLVEIFALWR